MNIMNLIECALPGENTIEFVLPDKIRADLRAVQSMDASQSPVIKSMTHVAGSRVSDGTSLVSRPIQEAVTQRIRLLQSSDQVRSPLISNGEWLKCISATKSGQRGRM